MLGVRAGAEVSASPRLAFLISVRHGQVNSFQYQKEEAHRAAACWRNSSARSDPASGNAADRQLGVKPRQVSYPSRSHPPPGRDWAEGEWKMMCGFVADLGQTVKRPLSDSEIAAIGKVLSSVGLIRDRRKRKRLLRRVREKARSVELGLKAKSK
jgi:hypothetical protein